MSRARKKGAPEPTRKNAWTVCLVGALTILLLALSSPVWVLGVPGSWKRHVYQEISFQLIARHVLPSSNAPKDVIRAAIRYTQRHLWVIDNQPPYVGQPVDYLVEGIGWCDYHAKVFCK